jgi:hypothetical protein
MNYEKARGDMNQMIVLVKQRLGMKNKKVALEKTTAASAMLLRPQFCNMLRLHVIDCYYY